MTNTFKTYILIYVLIPCWKIYLFLGVLLRKQLYNFGLLPDDQGVKNTPLSTSEKIYDAEK